MPELEGLRVGDRREAVVQDDFLKFHIKIVALAL